MASMPFHVKATYEYSSQHEDDLSFAIGQIITVTEIEDDDWYVGNYTDSAGNKQDGLFPKNYVERYEPEAPPRPSRSRPKKDAPPAAPVEPAPLTEPRSPIQPVSPIPQEPLEVVSQSEVKRSEPLPPAPKPSGPPTPKSQAPKPTAAPVAKDQPPAPAPKPSGNSFKDRIAAFNKPAAPPVAPKPSNAGPSTGFIKKPFVAPPPARDAYVPPPRESAPTKLYRREEDPEIAEQQAQAQQDAEEVGLAGGEDADDAEGPKATSLKDRIAMLQKQQQEQAARRAEAGTKEKPKRPPKPRAEVPDPVAGGDDDDDDGDGDNDLTKAVSPAPAPLGSLDSSVEIVKQPSGRRPSDQSLEPPSREIPSDGNDADQSGAGETTEDAEASSTEVDEAEERARPRAPPAIPSRTSTSGVRDPIAKEIEEEAEHEDEDEMDDETRRKAELRARMAKMSGGMGMAGLFGAMPSVPPPKKSSTSSEKRAPSTEAWAPPAPPQRMPMVPVPGMGVPPRVQSPESEEPLGDEDGGSSALGAPPVPQERSVPLPPTQVRGAPPVPAERPMVAVQEGRAAPPPPPHAPPAQDVEEDFDEPTPLAEEAVLVPNPLPIETALPQRPGPQSPPAMAKRASMTGKSSVASEMSPSSAEKRLSRPPPPIPRPATQAAPVPDSRPPPPPPPAGAPPSRQSTIRDAKPPPGDGESDYEGDYDTDIASAVPHKDALKAHEREPSIDEGTLSEDAASASHPVIPPPAPPSQRAAPPPPPHQLPPSRQSGEAPRAPPPMPPPRGIPSEHGEDYDPYRYEPGRGTAGSTKVKPSQEVIQESDPTLYGVSPEEPPRRAAPPPAPATQSAQRHSAAPPPPPEHTSTSAPQAVQRQSQDFSRRSLERRSVEMSGRPTDGSSIARDVDLAETSQWWTVPGAPPPVFQNRPDVFYEMEESSTSKRGGRTTVSRDVYVLFQDYSQSIITVRFDPRDPSNNVHLEQRHEAPPSRLRQDQLEAAHAQFGQAVASAATQTQNTAVGDGSAQGFILELLDSAAPNALKPVGTRAYGVLVYANMGNASVQQYDEIRPGDVVSFRNAKFQGKHGAMHAKYSLEVGKPEHVAVVMEWDGTKKKIRAWEQGREKEGKKVRLESFKVGDLRSGEVKVWRLVGRDWVGWDVNA